MLAFNIRPAVRRVSVPSATAGFACIANVPPTGAWHLASQLGDASIQNPPSDRRVSVPSATAGFACIAKRPRRVPGTCRAGAGMLAFADRPQ